MKMTELTKEAQFVAKAFGGCFKCFGKGYGTQTAFYTSRRWSEKAPTIVFCSCERGKQLKRLLCSNKSS